MSVIGNPLITTNYISDSFSGDASTVAFTLSQAPASAASIAVYISGLYQIPISAYSISGTTLTFTGAPPTGTNNITVLHLGVKSATLVPVNGSVTPQMLSTANVIYWSASNNNIGIGNVTPTSLLTVTGTAALGNTTITGTLTASANVNLDSGTFFVDGTNDRIGIGTSNPQTKVHVGSNTTAPGFGTASEMVYNIGVNQPEFLVRQTSNSVVCSIAADSAGGYVRTATNHDLRFITNNVNQMNLTAGGLLQFNSGYGSVATAYGCRAFAKFNGVNNTIQASGNISSITDRGTGFYRANFNNNLPDDAYTVVTAAQPNGYSGAALGAGGLNGVNDSNTNTYVALECRNYTNNNNEPNELFFAVFR